ncbi:MAG: DUF1836 domain-containing protein [Erysipelotrichaceae bacterium]
MQEYISQINDFHLPRYSELPTIELYSDQLISYINSNLQLISVDKPLTTAMINNYVKNGLISKSNNKKYNRNHIAYLIVVYIFKQIYSIEEIRQMINIQISVFDIETAYDYFAIELENALKCVLNHQTTNDSTTTNNEIRLFVHNSVLSFAYRLQVIKMIEFNK